MPQSHESREPQLAYSELQPETHDAQKRSRKAAKIVSVLQHFFGRDSLSGLLALDLGCSTGFTVDVLRAAGCEAVGIDIDAPGLAHANAKFGRDSHFICADGARLPFADKSVDIVVFNHIYEHVVDPDAIMSEIHRVLRRDGAVYLGLANKLGIVEPHYRLPFLSWVPKRLADKYVRVTRRADNYYEQLRTRRGLRRMCSAFEIWDYTYTILADPAAFCATDLIPERLGRMPSTLWHAGAYIMPTFVWVGTPGGRSPASMNTRATPNLLDRLAQP